MRDIQHHGHYDFEDLFMWKESAKNENFNFFKLISPTFSTWAQFVPQYRLNFISNHTLEDLLRASKSMTYESMMYVYGWMMEEHQPIGIDYQPT